MRVKGLHFQYKNDSEIIKNLSLTFSSNAITSIIGPNGCGKSTLLKLLSRNLKPSKGVIYLDDLDLKTFSKRAFARKLATVHQKMNVPEGFTVRQYIELGRYSHESWLKIDVKKETIVQNILQQLNLVNLQNKKLASLSGGEAQRVFLATALVQEPRYILLDEPTTYLDIHYQYQVLDTIRTLKDHYHITFIMVLHDINQAIEYSDEVICLNDKGVIAQGAPQEVINETILKEMYQIDAKIINDSECGMIVCRKRVRDSND
ncbi:heme ABC transporter ATP-binding protein [Staphylococcus sp. TE8]|uniref:ABC transporter ATP-binding protein n=1 Tax=Staphylococcus sp. TE8 TaxID=1472720 RepID=UPI0004A0F05B|nr:ABC transporter ATP-binding protein [Staphylococcus sp. TE8]KDE95952.1 heme ABC transporter ATP-binding protein [Staphylococcus sp. TE8]